MGPYASIHIILPALPWPTIIKLFTFHHSYHFVLHLLHVGENKRNYKDDKAWALIKKLPVEPTHIHFLNRVQKPTRRLQSFLKEKTTKLSFFFGADLIADLATACCVEEMLDLPWSKNMFNAYVILIIRLEPELNI